MGHLSEWLVLVKALRGAGAGQSILDKVALYSCGGECEVDSLSGTAELVDAFSELSVAGNVSCNPPVIDFLHTVHEDLVMGAVSLEDGEEPLGEGLCGGIFVVINSRQPPGFGIDGEGVVVIILAHGGFNHAGVHGGDADIASLGTVSVVGDNKLRILLVDFKTLRFGCGLMALWSRCCQCIKVSDVGGLLLIIPFEVEVLLSGLFVAELGFSKSVFEALSEASGKGGDVQSWVLGMFFEKVESGVWGDGSSGVKDLLDGRQGGGDKVFNLFVDVDDVGFIVGDNQRWGGGRQGRGFV